MSAPERMVATTTVDNARAGELLPRARAVSTPGTGAVARNALFDFMKGALVWVMVMYHWLNYFVSPQGDFYRYLRFLTPSFIFITGFLISYVYLAAGPPSHNVPKRLMQRGLKILGVFIVLNVLRKFVIPASRAGLMPVNPWSLENLVATFATGNVAAGGTKGAAFNILVPIGYLLLVSAGAAALCRVYKHIVHAALLCFLLVVFVLRMAGFGNGLL